MLHFWKKIVITWKLVKQQNFLLRFFSNFTRNRAMGRLLESPCIFNVCNLKNRVASQNSQRISAIISAIWQLFALIARAAPILLSQISETCERSLPSDESASDTLPCQWGTLLSYLSLVTRARTNYEYTKCTWGRAHVAPRDARY